MKRRGVLTRLSTRLLTIPLYRSETTHRDTPNGPASTTDHRVPNGELTGHVTLTVDIEAIVQHLGERALRSKGGKARGMGGAVVVSVDRSSLLRKDP